MVRHTAVSILSTVAHCDTLFTGWHVICRTGICYYVRMSTETTESLSLASKPMRRVDAVDDSSLGGTYR
jgi:hypothetical protein